MDNEAKKLKKRRFKWAQIGNDGSFLNREDIVVPENVINQAKEQLKKAINNLKVKE